MNPTFKQVTKTRYIQLVAELAQEIFVQHYTKLTPKVAAALADKKRRGDTLPLVLPEAIGRCRLEPVPVSELPDWFRDGGLL